MYNEVTPTKYKFTSACQNTWPIKVILILSPVLIAVYFQTGGSGLVVVQERRILGLHCSSSELHAGQVAVVKHGPRLAGCDLYFSRKPCSTCLKMIINGMKGHESNRPTL